MPWTEKQLKLFRAAEHNPAIAKKTGIKQSDAKRMAHEGLKKMAKGGIVEEAMKSKTRQIASVDSDSGPTTDLPPEDKADKAVEGTKRNTFARAVMDKVLPAKMQTYKKGGKVKDRTYYAAKGGRVDVNDPNESKEASIGKGEHKWQEKGRTKGKNFSSGGSVSGCRGVGIAVKGHGKGRMC